MPSFLTGGTLPILVCGLTPHGQKGPTQIGRRVSRLYWVNTLGAVAGAIAAGFILLPTVGLRLSVTSAVLLNACAGAVALRVSRHFEGVPTALPANQTRSEELEAAVKRFPKGLLPADLRASETWPALEAAAESSLDLVANSSADYVHALDGETPTAALEVMRGRLGLKENRTAEAVAHLSRATMLEPDNADALYWLAIAKHITPNDLEGDILLTRILRRDPKNLPALASRVTFARDRRDWRTGAQAQVERMAAMKDSPSSEFCTLGDLWVRAGNLTSAEETLVAGLERDPYSYLCHRELGEVDRLRGRLTAAREHLELVVRMYPDADSGTYVSLALVYRAQEHPDQARDILAKGLRIFPRDPLISRMSSH